MMHTRWITRGVTCLIDGDVVDHMLVTLQDGTQLDWCQRCRRVFVTDDDRLACRGRCAGLP